MTQHSRLQSVDIGGEQVVLDDAPVLGPVGRDDVMVVEVVQGRLRGGFAASQVGGAFGLDHSVGTRSSMVPLTSVCGPAVVLLSQCWTVIS